MHNRYYQDELNYLRELGRQFANEHPALAPMLADRGGDPDVERLLEGVAFLTGRIRQKLDDELPELVHEISTLLFPHLVRPLPAATILALKPKPNSIREGRIVPKGTEFASVEVDGTSCVFRSVWDAAVTPLTVSKTALSLSADGKQQLEFELRGSGGGPATQLLPSALRLYLAGNERDSLQLRCWLLSQVDHVVVRAGRGAGGEPIEFKLRPGALPPIVPVGFDEAEAMLPFGCNSLPGFRLLQEYYVLPAKFAFVDLLGLDGLTRVAPESNAVSVAVRFKRPMPIQHVPHDALRLHCVPVVNLFDTTSEPIRVTPERERFLVRPAGLESGHGEVYCIREVRGLARGRAERLVIPPFFGFAHAAEVAGGQRQFYSIHAEPSTLGDGADIYISLGTSGTPAVAESDVLSVDLLATNGPLASAVRAGELRVPTPSSPPFAEFTNLSAASPHVPPPMGQELQWRAIAHVGMSLRALTEPEILRTALAVYDLHATVDRQAARACELRVEAVKNVTTSPVDRLYRGAAVRGIRVEVELDEAGFRGEGDLFLFGTVLERLFASYVSVNSFSETTVRGSQSNVRYSWPPRSGNTTLL